MARPRSSVAEFERLVRLAEVGGNNFGPYLRDCGDELAPRLGIDVDELRAVVDLPDEEVAARLQAHFERRAEHRAALHADAARRLTLAAAEQLAMTAAWNGEAAMLEVRVLLGELLVDKSRSHLLFDATSFSSRFRVSLQRSLLINVAKEIGSRPDLGAWVDESGLHFRWNNGRGGFNFISQAVSARDVESILRVNIPPPFVERPRPRLAATGAWLSEILSELAFA